MGRNVRPVTDLPVGGDGNPPPRARLSECLHEAGIEQAQTVIAMADTDEDNLQICRMAREVHAVRKLLAWVRDPAYNARFRAADVRIVDPAYAKLLLLESMALDAGQIDGRIHENENHEIRIVKLQNRWLADRELQHMNLPDGIRVLRIERRGAVLEAEPATVLRTNDTLTVVGARDDVDAVTRHLARRW